MSQNRRKFITGIATLAGISLAGCSDFGDSFEYPDGFSENGIENYSQAFGEESAHYQADSLVQEIGLSNETESPEFSDSIERSIYTEVSAVEERQYVETSEQSVTREQYFDDGVVFIRTSSEGQETEYQRFQQGEFNKNVAYSMDILEFYLEGTSFEQVELTERNTVIYESDLSDPENRNDQLEENVEDGLISVEVTEEGYPINIDISITRENEDQTSTEEFNIEFSEYNEVSVDEPDWLDEAREQTDEVEEGGTEQPPIQD